MNVKTNKINRIGRGKKGFTLVELSVVLALIGILTAMIATFSVLMRNHAANTQADYEFLEDRSRIKTVIKDWVAENDVEGAVFSVSSDGELSVSNAQNVSRVSFSNGVLSLGEKNVASFNSVDDISFSSAGGLVKCVISYIDSDKREAEASFVFSLRVGDVASEVMSDE